MQRETVAATPAAALSLASKSKDNEAKALDKAIKGPPLASRSHTLQILVMLSLNSFLLFMCLYVLPAHLLWRKALKQHILAQEEIKLLGTNNNAASTGDSLLSESVAAANAASTSATKNILVAFQLLFKIPIKDAVGVAGIRRGYRSALAALVLSEGWFVARYKGWWEEAEAMERGDRDEVLKRRKVGIGARMEDVTIASFALLIPVGVLFLVVILCGAPIMSKHLDTLILSAYLSVFAFFAAFTFLGTDETEWTRAFAFSSSSNTTPPRYKLLVTQVTCTLLGALIGSAGHLLDWEKAWQIYPVPTILGSSLGLIIGNGLGFLIYYQAVSSSTRRVERRANSSTTSSKKKKKKNR